ncbi:MAG: hypothetical protein V2B20_17495 [Pseudomonadota bacterium]
MATVELSADYLPDCGRVKCFHVVLVFEQPGGLLYNHSRQGENLKKVAVKGNQVFFYQLVADNNIVIHRKTEQRADLVVVVIGKSLAISHKYQEKIQEQFILGEAGKKAPSKKAVIDPGKTSVYLPDAIANKRVSIDHVRLQDVKNDLILVAKFLFP